MRSTKQVFSKQHNTNPRSKLQDYDYVDKLSQADKDWLARFTENYYSSSFDKNPAFVKTKELIPVIEFEITKAAPKAKLKWEAHLTRVTSHTTKFYQVSENQVKSHDIDLRKLRNVDIFYKKPEGGYSTSKYYKYSENNVIDATNDSLLKACNDRSNSQAECVMSKFGANRLDDYEIDTEHFSPEDYMLFNEAADELIRLEEE